jgi:hypothetical protein
MKVRVEIDENQEDEIIIKAKELNTVIQDLQKIISDFVTGKTALIVYKEDKQYYSFTGEGFVC